MPTRMTLRAALREEAERLPQCAARGRRRVIELPSRLGACGPGGAASEVTAAPLEAPTRTSACAAARWAAASSPDALAGSLEERKDLGGGRGDLQFIRVQSRKLSTGNASLAHAFASRVHVRSDGSGQLLQEQPRGNSLRKAHQAAGRRRGVPLTGTSASWFLPPRQ